MSPSNSRQPRVRDPSLKREKHLHRKCFLWWRRGELRHKGRAAKRRCVCEGGSDTPRAAGEGESVLLCKPPNLRARINRTLVCKKKERSDTHR